MKKVMSILTATVLVVGAAAMVSFSVEKKSSNQTKAWFYMDGNQPDTLTGPLQEPEVNCEGEGPVCARQYNLDPLSPNSPGTPTGAPDIHGERID